jgi:hypothetical protein
MKIRFSNSTPSPAHLIWGFIAIGAIFVAGFVHGYFHNLPECPFKVITGYPCLTCGGTRCLAEMSYLSLWESFEFNPFIWVTVIGMIGFSIYVAIALIFKKSISISMSPREEKAVRIAIISLMAINWIYLIIYLK